MNPSQFNDHIKRTQQRLIRYINRDAPRIAGIESLNFFRESFDNRGFTDTSLVPWAASKRTDAASKWFGFEYRATTPPPDNHPKRSDYKRKYKARKPNAITNFSPAATKRGTLTGFTGDLEQSLEYTTEKAKAIVSSNLPYSDVHNEGGTAKLFGKKTVNIPQRQFIGYSQTLENRIMRELETDINNILNSQ